MTRQGPPSAFAKTVYHLELSKTAGASLAEIRMSPQTVLDSFTLWAHWSRLHESRDLSHHS